MIRITRFLDNSRSHKMRYLRVFDLDGCLYNDRSLPDGGFYKLCDEANALSACAIFPELRYEQALKLAALSFERHHDCYGAFLSYAEAEGHDPMEARRRIFRNYHATLFNLLDERHPSFFDHTAATAEAFERTSGGPFANAILSHSCMEGWGQPVLKKMGLLQYFEPHLLFGMDDYGFARKFESPEPMRRMIEASRTPGDRIVFLEDSWRNTQPAFRQFGVQVALVHYDSPAPSPTPAGVRWVCRTPAEVMDILEQEYTAHVERGTPLFGLQRSDLNAAKLTRPEM